MTTVPETKMKAGMKKKGRVFLSFEFGRDNELHYNFYSQAALYSQYEIIDYSLKEPYHPDARWLEKARKQIALSDIVIVMVGQDAYVQDPESGQWFKGVPDDDDFLGSIQMVGMFQIPNDPDAELGELVELEDGTKGYTIVSEQTGPQSGMAGIGLPGGNLTWIVGVDDFLTREVKVSLEGAGDKPVDFVSMSYGGYNEEFEIEPPTDYTALPDEMMQPGPPGVAMVVNLTKNDDGDVEVKFDKPVQVQGTVELYVLEPSTGGWGLPLLSGSGTDTLIFDADAEGRPKLVAGESQIAGFTFPDFESRLVDSDGTGVNLNFDLWTYK